MTKPDHRVVITTSWDDGHVLDLSIAELLSKYGLQGTFYVLPPANRATLSSTQLKSLSSQFELGAHTLDHTYLKQVSCAEARRQVTGSKEWLENLTGEPCWVFCFPGGQFSPQHLEVVREAGFAGVRTVELLSTKFPTVRNDLSVLPTTVQAYPHSSRAYLKNAAKRGRVMPVLRVAARIAGRDWVKTAERLLRHVVAHGGVFHLWGHSWEIDALEQWAQLESVLRLVAEFKSSASFLRNSDLCLTQSS